MSCTPGQLFIVSAPSGAGKTTLCRALLRHDPAIGYSVSYTTRTPRPDEIEGVDYHFISAAEFAEGIRAGRWAEWAEVHGNHYGTDAGVLKAAKARGRDLLLDIDVQGTRQLLERFPEAVTVFVVPPSLAELRKRLESRSADSPAVIERRLAAAEKELQSRHLYRHIIVNDELQAAVDRLIAVVEQHRRCRRPGPQTDGSPPDP